VQASGGDLDGNNSNSTVVAWFDYLRSSKVLSLNNILIFFVFFPTVLLVLFLYFVAILYTMLSFLNRGLTVRQFSYVVLFVRVAKRRSRRMPDRLFNLPWLRSASTKD